MADAKNFCLVLITCSATDEGEKIARALVEERLVACVNIVPQITSIYSWQGKVEQGSEVLLVCKTDMKQFPAVEKRVKELHSYDLPEVIAVSLAAGSHAYLDWLAAAVA